MKKTSLFFALSLVLFVGCAKVVKTEVELSEVPSDVEYTILDRTEGSEIERIEYQVKDTTKTYIVTYTENGLVKKFRVDPTGKIIE